MTIEIANRLYELRKQHNLSQEELAEKLGVSRQAVSKWERCEASPDTDNLISLAKIYDLTLDALIYGDKSDKNSSDCTSNGNKTVNIGPTGIFVESEDGDKVHINLDGVKIIENEDQDYKDSKVKINLGGIKIGTNSELHLFDDDDEDDDEDEDEDEDEDSTSVGGFWRRFPYTIICALLYLVFGYYNILGGWDKSWIIFITIPLYYSIVDAIAKRRFSEFSFSILTAFIYLYIGLYHGNWHPGWIVFFANLIYDPIAKAIDKSINKRENNLICK